MQASRRRWGVALGLLVASALVVYIGWLQIPGKDNGETTGEADGSEETTKATEVTGSRSAPASGRRQQEMPPKEGAGSTGSARSDADKQGDNDNAAAQDTVVGPDSKVCVYTPAGQAYNVRFLNHWRAAAQEQRDILIGLQPYASETEALADFRKDRCAAAFLPGDLLKDFNRYTYTISAFGALPESGLVRDLLREIRKTHNKARLSTEQGDVLGILPAGSARLVSRKGPFDELDELSGLEVAIDFERVSELLGSTLEIKPFPADDVSDMVTVFRHRSGAMLATPLQLDRFEIGHDRGELYVLETPIFQRTWQLIVQKDQWTSEFEQFTRDYFDDVLFDKVMAEVEEARNAWSSRFFRLGEASGARFREILRELRQSEREQGGYDSDMLLLLNEIRCGSHSPYSNCS